MPLFWGGGALGVESLLERHRIKVERHDLRLALGERAPAKLRAVAMGDFHYDPLCEADYISRCVALANSLEPDVVLLTGDFVTSNAGRVKELAELLSALSPRHGIYACLGNHDLWHNAPEVTGRLRAAGVDVLINQHTRVSCDGGGLVVAGLQSAWGGTPNWANTMKGMRDDERPLVLMHEPDFASRLSGEKRIAMQFSGHTHGGQIRLPFYGALRLPSWGKQFQAGLYDVNSLPLHVNRGIGTISIHVRLFCRPEIACFDITNTGATPRRASPA